MNECFKAFSLCTVCVFKGMYLFKVVFRSYIVIKEFNRYVLFKVVFRSCFVIEEFNRCEIIFDITTRKLVDVQNIFHKMEQRTLSAAYKFYCNKDLTNAHSAEADTIATYEVMLSQLEKYDTLKNDIDFLSEFSSITKNVDLAGRIVYNEKNEEVFNFGKYKGRAVVDVFKSDTSYYDWMMKGDFAINTKQKFTEILNRTLLKKG